MSTTEIVRIGPDDWRDFRDVRLASLQDAPGAFGATYDDWVGAAEDRWRQRLTDVPFTLLARDGVDSVGVVSGADTGSAVELISMWVAPSHRGTGVAGTLIGHVVAWAADAGKQTFLMVREKNDAAIRSYLRAGFVDLGVPSDWPEDAPRERRMRHGA